MSDTLQEGYYRKALRPAKTIGKAARKLSRAIKKLDDKIDDIQSRIKRTSDTYKKAALKKKLEQLINSRNILADKIGMKPLENPYEDTYHDEKENYKSSQKQGEKYSELEKASPAGGPAIATAGLEKASLAGGPAIATTKDGVKIGKDIFEPFKKKVLGESLKIFSLVEQITGERSIEQIFQEWFKKTARKLDFYKLDEYSADIDKVREDFVEALIKEYHVPVAQIIKYPKLAKFIKDNKELSKTVEPSKKKTEKSNLPEDVQRLIDLLKELPYEGKIGKQFLDVINNAFQEIVKISVNKGQVKG